MSAVWSPRSVVAADKSVFTLKRKVYAWDGQDRSITVKVPTMELEVAREWQAWALRLNGIEGTFYLREDAMQLFGTAKDPSVMSGFTPLVNGPDQIGSEINTNGWPPSELGVLKKGDWISIGDRLFTVTLDVDSDTAGNAELSIWPFARGGLADNAVISLGPDARGIFNLVGFPEFALNAEKMMEGFTFVAEETL